MSDYFKIDGDAVYDTASVCVALGLGEQVLARARKTGALRYSKQGRRILYLGRWLTEWLESTEATREGEGVSNAS